MVMEKWQSLGTVSRAPSCFTVQCFFLASCTSARPVDRGLKRQNASACTSYGRTVAVLPSVKVNGIDCENKKATVC